MNEDLDGLERIVDSATAASDAPQGDLTPEAQSLREAWLAFGRLLEADQSSALPPRAELRLPPAPRRWPLAVAAALAASLLIGASVYWMFGGGGTSGGVRPTANQVASTAVAVKPSVASTTGDLRWDDSFDQQIADARQGVTLAQSDLAHNFDEIDFVRYGIRQTQQDFEKDKL
jgi:hypothetical protein